MLNAPALLFAQFQTLPKDGFISVTSLVAVPLSIVPDWTASAISRNFSTLALVTPGAVNAAIASPTKSYVPLFQTASPPQPGIGQTSDIPLITTFVQSIKLSTCELNSKPHFLHFAGILITPLSGEKWVESITYAKGIIPKNIVSAKSQNTCV